MPQVHRTVAQHVRPRHTFVPTDAQVVSIRKAFAEGDPDSLGDAATVPKGVHDYRADLKKHEAKGYDSVSVQSFTVGKETYYLVDADNEGNGFADIVDPKGHKITGYSYSESEGPNWDSSPGEAKIEAKMASDAQKALPRNALGTAALKNIEVKASELPDSVQQNWAKGGAGVADQHFYKLQLRGEPAFAVYTLYKNPNSDQLGFVYVFDKKGSTLGEADITKKGGDKLNFGFSIERAGT